MARMLALEGKSRGLVHGGSPLAGEWVNPATGEDWRGATEPRLWT